MEDPDLTVLTVAAQSRQHEGRETQRRDGPSAQGRLHGVQSGSQRKGGFLKFY